MENKVKFKGRYTGLPFRDKGRGPDAFDCWGLVFWIYKNELGLILPDYLEGYDGVRDEGGIQTSIRQGLDEEWVRLDGPAPMSLLVLNIFKKPIHVGIMTDEREFLHCPEGDFSRKERIADRMWRNRIEGFYRHASMAGPGQITPVSL